MPTHRFIGQADINGDPSPYTGLLVTLLQQGGYSEAGFNGVAQLHTDPADLARRHNDVRTSGPEYTATEVSKLYSPDGWDFDVPPDALLIEVDTAQDLGSLQEPAS